MISLAAALAVALALGTGTGGGAGEGAARGAGRPGTATLSNAARARAGLLPRKPPKKVRAVSRSGRRIITAIANEPTFLGEPVPHDAASADGSGVAVQLTSGTEGDAVDSPPPISAPVWVSDEVHLAAAEVVTEVTISLHYP